MKTMIFILTVLVSYPFVAEAETVFNETQSFQMAKAVKLGRGKGANSSAIAKPSTKKSADGTTNGIGKKQAGNCPWDFFLSDGKCIKICDGTTCKAGFEKHPSGNKCYCY